MSEEKDAVEFCGGIQFCFTGAMIDRTETLGKVTL